MGPADATRTRGVRRYSVRLWVPDRPGMLGAVAMRLAALGGNVVGLEVLERSGEVAVDELMVELPDGPPVEGGACDGSAVPPSADGRGAGPGATDGTAVVDGDLGDALARHLRSIEGVGVEEVRPVRPGVEERGLQVIDAAVSVLETANPAASLASLAGLVDRLFDVEWSALVDLATETCVQASGQVPPVEWLLAFLAGSRRADTSGSGVMAAELAEAGLVVCIGRRVPFRHREQRELDMLARVTDRMCRPLRDRIPAAWTRRGRFPGD